MKHTRPITEAQNANLRQALAALFTFFLGFALLVAAMVLLSQRAHGMAAFRPEAASTFPENAVKTTAGYMPERLLEGGTYPVNSVIVAGKPYTLEEMAAIPAAAPIYRDAVKEPPAAAQPQETTLPSSAESVLTGVSQVAGSFPGGEVVAGLAGLGAGLLEFLRRREKKKRIDAEDVLNLALKVDDTMTDTVEASGNQEFAEKYYQRRREIVEEVAKTNELLTKFLEAQERVATPTKKPLTD